MDQSRTDNFGQCALCRKERTLRDSHLMPKWVYRRLQQSSEDKGPPVFVSGGSAVQTSKQVTKYLLCDDCEKRFGIREDYVAGITEVDSTGKIKLTSHVSRPESPSGRLVVIGNQVDTGQIAYFAASVIWRACVMGSGCRLGRYEADFRNYLMGEADFPSAAAISMAILETPLMPVIRPEYWATMPTSIRAGAVWLHGFIVAGLAFRCHVGAAINLNMQKVCLVRSEHGKFAMMAPGDQLEDFQRALGVGAAAIPRGKFAQYMRENLGTLNRPV